MSHPTYIICLVPVKNEAWILDRFLKCASAWADKIIIADQMSTDGSREIALRYPKVQIIDNSALDFNEPVRQKLLLSAARATQPNSKKLIITLDADECLTGDFEKSQEWRNILDAREGTVIRFDLVNLHPDGKRAWLGGSRFPWGFMDDGISQHEGKLIHSKRIPLPVNAPTIDCRELRVVHYQFTDWQRMQSKHRWYQCYELLNRTHLRPLTIFRNYHHMYGLSPHQLFPVDNDWFNFYEQKGIDMKSVLRDRTYWWDAEVDQLFSRYGHTYFASLAIWENQNIYQDPRNWLQKTIHDYLLRTQRVFQTASLRSKLVRILDKFLKFILR